MEITRIAVCFIGTVGFAILVVVPFPEHSDPPSYFRPLFAACSILSLACGLWIVRRRRANSSKPAKG